MACTGGALEREHPGIAHMHWDNAPIVRRVVGWANAVRKGKPDH